MTQAAWIPDHSAIACFRESPEKFRLQYRLNLVPASPDTAMLAGSVIHAGLNVLRANASDVESAVAVARAHRGDAPGRRDATQVEKVIRAYAQRYASEPFAYVANEEYAEARIACPHARLDCVHSLDDPCTGFDYCGIIDSCVRFPDASEYVMDCKSTGAYLNEGWQTMMSLSDQMVGYVALRRALGHRCDGFLVDGIHLNDYVPKPKKGETFSEGPKVDLEKDFVRVGPIRVEEWRVERWVRDMQYTLAQIAALETTRGLDTPWPMYQNWAYGKVDAYRDFYEAPAELHAQIAQLYEKREWKPREVAAARAVADVTKAMHDAVRPSVTMKLSLNA